MKHTTRTEHQVTSFMEVLHLLFGSMGWVTEFVEAMVHKWLPRCLFTGIVSRLPPVSFYRYWAFEHSGLNFDQRLGFCLRSQHSLLSHAPALFSFGVSVFPPTVHP